MINFSKKIFRFLGLSYIAFSMLALSALPALAEDTTTDTSANQNIAGPQSPTGPQEPTGPQGPTGPQSPTGPQVDTGATIENPTPSPSSSTELTNSDTGADSNNINVADTNSDTTVNNTNDSITNNDLTIGLNSGLNNVGNNSVVGNTSTGDINSVLNLFNVSNSLFAPGSSVGSVAIDPTNQGQIILIPSASRTLLENSNTGAGSQNINALTNLNTIALLNLSNAALNNGIVIDANTGGNTLSSNTVAGNLSTGNINLGVNLINIANLLWPNVLLSVDVFNILGTLDGNLVMPELANIATGADSSNQNAVTSSNNVGVTVDSTANIGNSLNINTNTGANNIGNNTVTGDISTGSTKIKSALTNIVNALSVPIIYIVNVFGKWTGQLAGIDPANVIVNEITGEGSDNINTVNNAGDTNATIQNNADVNNQLTINANTGGNTVMNNTKVGNISTGNITITQNIVNILNSLSSSLGKFAIRIINIFGNWNGNATATAETQSPPGDQPELDNRTNQTLNDNVEDINKVSSHLKINSRTYSNINGQTSMTSNNDSQATLKSQIATGISTNNNDGPTSSSGAASNNSFWGKLKNLNGTSKTFLVVLALAIPLVIGWGILEYLAMRYSKKAVTIK